jgi:hypothetical protein
MKLRIVKFLINRLTPLVRNEIILSLMTSDLWKQWAHRQSLHAEMILLSELLREASGGGSHIHHNPRKKTREA